MHDPLRCFKKHDDTGHVLICPWLERVLFPIPLLRIKEQGCMHYIHTLVLQDSLSLSSVLSRPTFVGNSYLIQKR